MLAPWKKSYDQPRQHIKKQRHYFVKGPSSQDYDFSIGHVWMWEWTIKKAEHRRIDAFEPWCCRRLLRVPWTARRSNQSILKDQSSVFIGRTDVEAEAPILWPCDAKNWFMGKDPHAEKSEVRRRRGQWRMRRLDGISDLMDMNLGKL